MLDSFMFTYLASEITALALLKVRRPARFSELDLVASV
jgi:hypothetical protein